MADVAQTFINDPYAAQQSQLNRQQKLAEILQSQAFAPDQKFSYGGIEASPSAAGALGKGIQGAISSYLMGHSMKGQDDLIKKASSDTTESTQALIKGLSAKPWIDPDTEKPSGTAGGYAGALASLGDLPDNPQAQKLAQALTMKKVEQDMAPPEFKALEPGATPGMVNRTNGQWQQTGPAAAPKPSDSIVSLESALKASGVLEGSPQWVKAHADLVNKETNFAPPPMVNVNSYLPASEAAQTEFLKGARATYDQLKQAPVALENIEKAKALVPAAAGFMGPGGDTLLNAAKFLNNRVGMSINTEGVKSAEELRSRIFENVMDNLKKMDASPSQQQQAVMQQALGSLDTDPQALPQVLDSFSDIIRGKIDVHNKEMQGAIERGVKFPYDPVIKIPTAGGRTINPMDQQALDWAKSNPNDPRAAAIMKKLGQ
jgi:hypothetical protein